MGRMKGRCFYHTQERPPSRSAERSVTPSIYCPLLVHDAAQKIAAEHDGRYPITGTGERFRNPRARFGHRTFKAKHLSTFYLALRALPADHMHLESKPRRVSRRCL